MFHGLKLAYNISKKLFARKKGSVYTLEASIAVVIMITVLVLLLKTPKRIEGLNILNYKMKVYGALEMASEVGDLRRSVINNDITEAENELENYMPSQMDYELAIYNKTDPLTEEPSIDSDNVITVSYLFAGYAGRYEPREIRVFLWNID